MAFFAYPSSPRLPVALRSLCAYRKIRDNLFHRGSSRAFAIPKLQGRQLLGADPAQPQSHITGLRAYRTILAKVRDILCRLCKPLK